MAIASCKQKDLSRYLTSKMMLRMMVPTSIHQAVVEKTMCPAFITNHRDLMTKPNQSLQVNPSDVNAYMERGLVQTQVNDASLDPSNM